MTKRNNEARTETLTPGARVLCPLCGKAVKVKANGRLAHHGNRISWGVSTRGGHCIAAGHDLEGALRAGIAANEGALADGFPHLRGVAKARAERTAKENIARFQAKLPAERGAFERLAAGETVRFVDRGDGVWVAA